MNTIRITIVALACACMFTACDLLEKPVTEIEAIAFAKEIEKSIADKNPTLFNEILDVKTFAARIEDSSNGKITRRDLATLPNELKKRKLGNEMLQVIGEDGSYRLVKHYVKDKKMHLLFRIYGQSGINYHDLELVRSGDKIKAADLYIYMSGEWFSRTVANLIIDITDYYKDKEGQTSAVQNMKRLRKLMDEEKYEEAKKKFDALPHHFKEQKTYQILNILITAEVDMEQYKAALQKYSVAFPNDPNLPLMLIDHHLLKEDYKSALADVDKLDAVINKDPFLDYYRGNIYNTMEDTAAALKHYEKLQQSNPNFEDGAVGLTALYLQQGQLEKAELVVRNFKAKNKLTQDKWEMFTLLYPEFKL